MTIVVVFESDPVKSKLSLIEFKLQISINSPTHIKLKFILKKS